MALVIGGIVMSRLHSYIMFHTLAELFGICVALTAFSLAWNTRTHIEDGFLLVVGLAMGPPAIVAMLHTVAYRGMGVFSENGGNLPTQLWIALQIIHAVAMLAATVPAVAKQPAGRILAGGALVTSALVAAILGGYFPDCFIEGQGLTPFKIVMEYMVMAAFAWATVRLCRDRSPREPKIRIFSIAALAIGCLESAAFTVYADVYGALNMAGHVLGLVQSLLIYTAVAWTGLVIPQRALYARQQALADRFADNADHANRDIFRFSEVLAHHLREPVRLQSIYADKLGKLISQPSEDVAECLDHIRRGGQRLLNLMNDVQVYMAACRQDASGVCSADVALDTVLSRMAGTLDAMGATIHRERLPTVRISPAALAGVLEQIILNAIRFRRPGIPPAIIVSGSSSGGYGTLSIRDNGIGIDPQYFDKIFGVFETLHAQDQYPGTGIGLALARRAIESVGGKISVKSSVGEWTEFTLSLPIGD